jgi:hypothetical protein
MTEINAAKQGSHDPSFWKEKLAGTHISPETLLATDYLNHFNEVIMLINMVADIPDVLDDLRQWHFKTYAEHFREGQLTYGKLAADLYEHVPAHYKDAFENVIGQLATAVPLTVKVIDKCMTTGETEKLKEAALTASARMTVLVDTAGAIIAGDRGRIAQQEVDKLFTPGG